MHSQGTVPVVDARWPSQRPDGSFMVAARYLVTRPEGRAALESYVHEWPRTHAKASALATEELSMPSQVVSAEGERLDVMFDAKAGSRLWKDVMVAFVHDAPTQASVAFEGFADLVGGGFRVAWPGQAAGF
jgi:hypothetical protein